MPDRHKLRLLVIEYNPLLSDGKRVSDLVSLTDSVRPSVDELIDDIRYSSHGLVNCEIVGWEREDCFPRHKKMFRLESGESPCLDEATVRKLFENGWYGWWNNEWFNKEVCPEDVGFTFDYQWMLEKHNIIERRNNNEFDMILIVNQDPVYGFEACMLGRNAYWINGDPIEADCPLTAILNVSVSRRDANYECHGHMMENIMSHVFHGDTILSGYEKGEFNGQDPEKMNVWNRFVLADRNFDGLAACGNVHFSPNSVADYDWRNETLVESNWRDWLENYPDFKGIHEPTNLRAYIPLGIGEKDACRLHHRWWFLCMPHVAGVNEDGYSHSWWDYYVKLDYVTEITPDASSDGFVLHYRSGAEKVVQPGDPGIFTEEKDGKITVKRDGVSCTR